MVQVLNRIFALILLAERRLASMGKGNQPPAVTQGERYKGTHFGLKIISLLFPIIFLSVSVKAQEPAEVSWSLQGSDAATYSEGIAAAGFSSGSGLIAFRHDEENGAMSCGWNSRSLDTADYYQYTIVPEEGKTLTITDINMEVNLDRVNMRFAVHYSTDNFRRQSTAVGNSVYVGMKSSRDLHISTRITISYPQTLSIRVYGWSAPTPAVNFFNSNVVISGHFEEEEEKELAEVKEELVPEDGGEVPLMEIGEDDETILEELAETEIQAGIPEEPLADMGVSDQPNPFGMQGQDTGGRAGERGSEQFTTPGSYQWTCPAGVTSVTVECWGGGAGGNNDIDRGGGGGAYAGNPALNVIPGNSYTITVGEGGESGESGTNSSFANLVVAAGANGANGGTAGASTGPVKYSGGNGGLSNSYGGAGGGGSGGAGGPGGQGTNSSSSTGGNGGAPGAAGTGSPGAAGGRGGDRYNGGSNGNHPGGGGGERGESSNWNPSGSGADGQVIITWETPPGYCEGNAISYDHNSVNNPERALGAPNNSGATLNSTNDWLQLDLTGYELLTAGNSLVVRWAVADGWGSDNADVCVQYSSDGGSWNPPTITTSNTITNTSWTNTAITFNVNTRYVRFTRTGGNDDLYIDAVSYNTPCAPPCTNPTISSHPVNRTICAPGNTSFSVTASGTALTYQWQVNTGTWGNVTNGGYYSGATSPNLNLTGVPASFNGYQYRCIVNSEGCTTTSNSATLTVNSTPSAPTANAGSNAQCTQFTANWSVSTTATGYFLDVSTVNTFATFVTGFNNLSVGNVLTYNVTGLTAGTTYYYRLRASNTCGTSSHSQVITYSTSPAAPSAPVANAGTNAQCTQFTANWTASLNATSYYLDVSTVSNFASYVTGYNNLNVNNVTTYMVTGLTAGITYYYRVRASNNCGTSNNSNVITYNTSPPAPSAPIATAGTNAQCTQFTANWNASANATGYYLDVSTVNTFATFVAGYNNLNVNNVTTYNVIGLTAGTTYYYRVRAYNGCGPSSNSGTITYSTLPGTPAIPGPITGDINTCQNNTEEYSISPVPNATNYTWTFPASWTYVSGQGSTTITLIAGTAGGTITVTAGNSCGTSSPSSITVNVLTLPAQTSPISPATTEVCQNSVHNFMVNPPAPTGVQYIWTGPPGSTILSGQNTNLISIRFGNQSGTLSVTPTNTCGTGPSQSLNISVSTSTPTLPSVISGHIAPCVGSNKTYSVTDEGYLYTWTVPAGWTITSGQGTASITVTVGATTGNISVTAGNPCGASQPRTTLVTPQTDIPQQPSEIQGTSPICAGATYTYSVTLVPFVTYTWTVPSGWTIANGQGTNSITVTAGNNSGIVTVTPSNDCGTGTARTRNIVVDTAPPAQPSVIAGEDNPCQNSMQQYTVTAISGVTYNWTVPSDWTINSGNGTNIINVTVGAINGNITVIPSNGCGEGTPRILTVTVFLLPSSAGTINGPVTFCEGTTLNYTVPNVTGITFNWTVPPDWGAITGQGTNSITVVAGEMSGQVTVTPQNSCGDGPVSIHNVTVNPLPEAFTIDDGELCVGQSINIGGPPVPGNTYSWTSVPPGFTSTESNPSVTPDQTTTYTLVETNPVTGCSNTNSVTIVANQVIDLTVNPISQTICTGGNTNITISSNIIGTQFNWTATLTGGSNTTFNPAGTGSAISETILNTSNAPSEVTYNITASVSPCTNDDLSVVVTINPAPVNSNQTPPAICSDVASGVILGASTNNLPIDSYNIISINSNGLTASAGNPVTGTGFAANAIEDDAWTNTTLNPVDVVYTVQGVSSLGCTGNTFTVTLAINPEPVMTNSTTKEICSGSSTNINLTSNINASYAWTIGTITGSITGASAGNGLTINQVLTNPSNTTPGTVDYIVTPTTGGCQGSPITITVTVHPRVTINIEPVYRICSGATTNIQISSTAPATYSWTIGTITGGIMGATASTGTTIIQTLTNPSNATSGTVQYIITPTSSSGGCPGTPFTITVWVDPIPSVSVTANPMSVCPGTPFDLTSSSSLTFAPATLLEQNFNGQTNNWTTVNNSQNGNPADAAWKLRQNNYSYGENTFQSNDNSQFYLSNSDDQGWGVTRTYLISPSINTVGYTSLSLDFYHYYRHYSSVGRVQVSTDNINWTTLANYQTSIGGHTNFQHETIDLSAYINRPNLYIRFYYYAEYGWYWAIDNVRLRGTSTSSIPIISWISNPEGFVSSQPSIDDVEQGETTTYTVSYTNPSSLCSNSASVTVITLPLPNATLTADYCAVPGRIQLTASGGGTYLWSTGQTGSVILVDVAGQYSVVVTGTNGCSTTASIGVSNELVTNGDFSAGNTGFTSGYSYDPSPNGLYAPESEYAVNDNARENHSNFWGYDHTTGTGNYMIVNGAKYAPQPTVWQQTVTVIPNTDYYFSAWAKSMNNEPPFARLRFEVNGVEVGTTAVLPAGVNNNNNPWPSSGRFYGTWNSGTATSAIIRIIDLETAAGGNDFGLDDISFGTLDPVPFVFDISANTGTNTACEGGTIQLESNIIGGMPPYVALWTGPNGFTSTELNPVINNATLAHEGTYTLTVHDSYGCTDQTDNVIVDIIPAPNASISGGGDYCQFGGQPLITLTGIGGTPPFTFEYNINGGPTETITTWGTEFSAIVFAPTNVTGTFVYNLTNVLDDTGCERTLSLSTTVVIHALPSAFITGELVVCPSSTNIYEGNGGMTEYEWYVLGNASISGVNNQQNVNVLAGSDCGTPFDLTLTVTDNHGCNAVAQETVVVDDTEDPVITELDNISLSGCNPDWPTQLTTTWTDNCSAGGSITGVAGSVVTNGCSQYIDYTFNVTDDCGNAATTTVTRVTRTFDNQAPVIVCPEEAPFTVFINNGAVYTHSGTSWDATATDNCGGTITLSVTLTGITTGTYTTLNGVSFNQGTTTVTWTATDVCGNTSTCKFNVIVEGSADIEVVKIGPANITAGTNIQWTITVTNLGPAIAPEVTLTDVLPVDVLSIEISTDGGTTWIGWSGTMSFTDLVVNAPQELWVRGEVDCASNDFINTAKVELSSPFIDPNSSNNESSVSTSIENQLTLSANLTNSECNDEGAIDLTVAGGSFPYTYLWTTLDGTIPAGQETQQDISGLSSGTYHVTVTDANGCQDTEPFTVTSEDTEAPTFDPPAAASFCVSNILSAVYDGVPGFNADIIPDPLFAPPYPSTWRRPDWYVLNSNHIPSFDLDIDNVEDNCCTELELLENLSWVIHFDERLDPPQADLSGTGQPSTLDENNDGIVDKIILWGTPDNVDVFHTITYTLTDCNDNVANSVTVNITIKPRPDVIKQP